MSDTEKLKWRYQPVQMTFNKGTPAEEPFVTFIEVYTPEGHPEGPLRMWDKVEVPDGYQLWAEDREALMATLRRMMACMEWEVVPYEDLHSGYIFKRAIDAGYDKLPLLRARKQARTDPDIVAKLEDIHVDPTAPE